MKSRRNETPPPSADEESAIVANVLTARLGSSRAKDLLGIYQEARARGEDNDTSVTHVFSAMTEAERKLWLDA
jgi:hypothetical protein